MARIAGIDLPPNKRVEIGLTSIYGVGRSRALKVLVELSPYDVSRGRIVYRLRG